MITLNCQRTQINLKCGFIPLLMRKSETYPPLTANGIAASHGIMLYTHPCKNRQVEEKQIIASNECYCSEEVQSLFMWN